MLCPFVIGRFGPIPAVDHERVCAALLLLMAGV
jgi:hypothetical protein